MITALSPVSTHGTPQIHCSTHLCTMQFCCYHLLSLCRWHSMSAICNTLTCRGMTVHQQPLTKELFNHSCVTALLGPIRSTLNHNWDCAYANNWLSISFSYKMVLEYRQPCSLDIRDFAGHHTTRHSCLLLLYTHTHTHMITTASSESAGLWGNFHITSTTRMALGCACFSVFLKRKVKVK